MIYRNTIWLTQGVLFVFNRRKKCCNSTCPPHKDWTVAKAQSTITQKHKLHVEAHPNKQTQWQGWHSTLELGSRSSLLHIVRCCCLIWCLAEQPHLIHLRNIGPGNPPVQKTECHMEESAVAYSELTTKLTSLLPFLSREQLAAYRGSGGNIPSATPNHRRTRTRAQRVASPAPAPREKPGGGRHLSAAPSPAALARPVWSKTPRATSTRAVKRTFLVTAQLSWDQKWDPIYWIINLIFFFLVTGYFQIHWMRYF